MVTNKFSWLAQIYFAINHNFRNGHKFLANLRYYTDIHIKIP